MTDAQVRKPRAGRTFSAFGNVHRMPSEYEIVTEGQNWTVRPNRLATFEQNPSSLANLWFLTHRDKSPLQAEDWNAFRDPAAPTYRSYVAMQAHAESMLGGVLETHAAAGADASLNPRSVSMLGSLFTPSRYLCHGFQQVEAYVGLMAPSPYVTSSAGYAAADCLRRVTTIAYRTRELQIAFPDSGIGDRELRQWESHQGWQPARKAVEYALVSYDWGEAFTALNLVLAPTLDDVLLTQLGQAAKFNQDNLTWLLASFLAEDTARRDAWSRELANLAVAQRPTNREVLGRWVRHWSGLADDAALGLGTILEDVQDRVSAVDVAAHAKSAREDLLSGLLEPASDDPTLMPGRPWDA
jgi:toluene monooxygenase system protein E